MDTYNVVLAQLRYVVSGYKECLPVSYINIYFSRLICPFRNEIA